MQLPLAIQNLKLHNQWRRGAEIDPLDPKVIGESIDAVVEAYQNSMVDPNSISEEDAHLVQLYVDTIRGVNCGRRTGATHRMIDLYAHRLLMNGEVVVTCNYKPDPEENRSECEYIYNAILKRIAHEQESFAFEANEERLTIKRTGFRNQSKRLNSVEVMELLAENGVILLNSTTTMWKPIDPHNLPEGNVFVLASWRGNIQHAYGWLTYEDGGDVPAPYVRCFVAHCGGSYVVDDVTHYLDPRTILATNDQTRG